MLPRLAVCSLFSFYVGHTPCLGLFPLVILGIELVASCIPGKCSTLELQISGNVVLLQTNGIDGYKNGGTMLTGLSFSVRCSQPVQYEGVLTPPFLL